MFNRRTTIDIGAGLGSGGTAFTNTYSLNFDGTDDRTVVSAVSALNLRSYTTWTTSHWFKTSSASAMGMFGCWEYHVNQRQWLTYLSAGQAFFFISETGTNATATNWKTTATGWADGNWHHMVFVYLGEGVTPKIYIDGSDQTLVSTSSAPFMLNVTNPIVYGCTGDGSPTEFFVGNLDEMSLWNTDLNSTKVTELYNSGSPADLSSHSSSANLIGWWRNGDGDTYPTITDNSTNSNNATMTNMTSSDFVKDTTDTVDILTHSVDFDGIDDHVVIPHSTANDLSGETAATFVAYFKTSASTLGAFIASYEQSTSDEQFIMSIRGDTTGKLETYIYDTGVDSGSSTSTGLNDGAWHLAVCSVTTSAVTFYIDGGTAEVDSTPSLTAFQTSGSSPKVTIGCANSVTLANKFTGRLAFLSIWKGYAFSQSDADELWNGGSVIDPNTHSQASSMTGYWKCGTGDTYPTLLDSSTNSNNGTMTNMVAGDIVADAP